jgi:hypothetical protein
MIVQRRLSCPKAWGATKDAPAASDYRAQKQVGARAQARYADVFTLEIGGPADAGARKQFETPEVLAADDRDRFTGVDRNHVGQCLIPAEVDLPASDRARESHPRIRRHIADVNKPFCTQQLFGRHTEARCKCR